MGKLVDSDCIKACVDSCPAQAPKASKKESMRGKGKFQVWMKTCLKKVMESREGKAKGQKAAFRRCVDAWKRFKTKGGKA